VPAIVISAVSVILISCTRPPCPYRLRTLNNGIIFIEFVDVVSAKQIEACFSRFYCISSIIVRAQQLAYMLNVCLQLISYASATVTRTSITER